MEVINQIGHVQFWGMSPAMSFLADCTEPSVKVLLTGCSDVRHILKTICDVCIQGAFKNVQIYFHETNKELICRALLLLHVIHEQNLNFDQRIELFLDLYGNCMIKEKTAKYLSNLVPDLQNLIHDEPKTSTTLKNFVDFKYLKFQERDELSEIVASWKINVPFDMEGLRDIRLRYLYKERYDYRTNLIDWDYNMLLTDYAPIVHYYHYRQWRQTGLAFENRYSTYVHPNRTLSSYIPGKKNSTKQSCMVRGYWGDIVCSPYLTMGIQCDYPQAVKLFKKANQKYIGHSMEVTEYNLRYYLEKIQDLKEYVRVFEDYYRSEQREKDLAQQKQKQKKQRERQQRNKQSKKEIKEEEEEEEKQVEKQKEQTKTVDTERKQTKQDQDVKEKESKPKQQEVKETKISTGQQSKEPKKEEVDITKPVRFDPKKMTEEQYEAKVKLRRQAIDARQVQYLKVQQPVLKGLKQVGFRFFPMCMNLEHLKKKKFQDFFDVGVIGFSHTAYLQQDIKSVFKAGARVYVETARFLISHRKEKRAELDQALEQIICSNGFIVTDRKLKHHLQCSKV